MNLTAPNASGIHFYSIGYCLVNKDPKTDIIRATPTSVFPMVDGEMVDHAETYNASGQDSFKGNYAESMETTIGIKCKWLCQDGNLLTPPDVRRGAKVSIYRMGNSDQFFWTLYTNTGNYQKLETQFRGYSNTQDENAVPDESNTWIHGADTRDTKRFVYGKTTRSDGEKFAYEAYSDSKENRMHFKDDVGNEILIDSENTIVRLQNANGTFLELNKGDINWGCENNHGKASNAITASSSTMEGNYSSGQTTTTPQHAHIGNIGLVGGLSATGGSTGQGFQMVGDINQIGSHTSTGDQIAGGISQINHTHRDSIGGTTSPPI